MAEDKSKTRRDAPRPTYGLVSVAVPGERVTRPVFGRKGFASAALLTEWPVLVGSAIAAHTLPVAIRFPPKERSDGTLVIKVESGAFALELQHLEPLILERINGFFGWKAVARLKLQQGPLPRRPAPPKPPPAPTGPPAAAEALERVEDPELRAVLERLGRHIAGKSP